MVSVVERWVVTHPGLAGQLHPQSCDVPKRLLLHLALAERVAKQVGLIHAILVLPSRSNHVHTGVTIGHAMRIGHASTKREQYW
jgi:hypothetical protein